MQDVLFRALARELGSRADFLAAHPQPALVVERLLRPSQEESGDEGHSSPFTVVPNDTVGPGGLDLQLDPQSLHSDARVHWLVKTDRNPFGAFVTLGRARNNDVIVPSSSVSKIHLFFTCEAGSWSVEDRGSTNGTFERGRRLGSGERLQLRSGMALRVGKSRRAWFLEPEELWEACQAARAKP